MFYELPACLALDSNTVIYFIQGCVKRLFHRPLKRVTTFLQFRNLQKHHAYPVVLFHQTVHVFIKLTGDIFHLKSFRKFML